MSTLKLQPPLTCNISETVSYGVYHNYHSFSGTWSIGQIQKICFILLAGHHGTLFLETHISCLQSCANLFLSHCRVMQCIYLPHHVCMYLPHYEHCSNHIWKFRSLGEANQDIPLQQTLLEIQRWVCYLIEYSLLELFPMPFLVKLFGLER